MNQYKKNFKGTKLFKHYVLLQKNGEKKKNLLGLSLVLFKSMIPFHLKDLFIVYLIANKTPWHRLLLTGCRSYGNLILPCCHHVGTTVWMRHLYSNKTDSRWELQKNALCYFKQILEPQFYKKAAVRSLTSHHTKHPNKTSKTCRVLKET